MSFLDKVKGLVSGNKSAVKGGLDKGAAVVERKTPDSMDANVKMAAEKGKDVVDGL